MNDRWNVHNSLEYNEEELNIFINSDKVNQIGYITTKYIIQDILLKVLQEKIYFNTKYILLENTYLLRSKLLTYICFPILSICTDTIGYAPVVRRAMNKYNCTKDEAINIYLANQTNLLEYKVYSDFVIYKFFN